MFPPISKFPCSTCGFDAFRVEYFYHHPPNTMKLHWGKVKCKDNIGWDMKRSAPEAGTVVRSNYLFACLACVFLNWRHYSGILITNIKRPHRHHMSHYNDVIMGAIGSEITSLTIVYSIVYSDANQRKHQSSASLAFVRGIHRGPVNSPHKWPVTRKMFPFHDVIVYYNINHAEKTLNSSINTDMAYHQATYRPCH